MTDDTTKSLDDWFVREVLPHEGSLTRLLMRLWRNADEISDFRQEVYARVYEASRVNKPQFPHSFLLTTARNLVADRIRRARIVSIEAMADLDELNVLVEERTPERHASVRQELRCLIEALNRLPPRCREVIVLRKVRQVSQREAAARLGIAEGTVEKQVAKGMRLLAQLLGADGATATLTENRLIDDVHDHKTRGD